MQKYCFGIDVGGTTVKCGLFDTKGEVLEKWEIPTRVENNGVNIIPDVAAAILAKLEEKGIAKDEVEGIGIGVPGPVAGDGTVAGAVNLHWGFVDVAGDMARLTGIRTMAGNDANVAALGEMWKGGGKGYRNLVMVTLGTGVGGGIIIDEKIVSGSHGAGGEIGHMHVDDSVTEACNCGNKGCLEQVVSATGVVRITKEALAASETPSCLRGGEISAKTVFDAVKAGDQLAMEVAERFGRCLGTALAGIACVADPEVFVIGGGVSKAGQVILDYVEKYYQQYAFKSCRDAAFALATLGNDAGIYGAARLVL